ncbi:glyoxalase superfamily protein [Nocardia sp. NPDC051030]|uniref:glyoxalase superfamily protein n=1 Tax=Nocardia sp. NPDC051030 TaxID=3155162 RepID=UPI003444E7E5
MSRRLLNRESSGPRRRHPRFDVWVPISDIAAWREELHATGYERMNPGIDVDSPGGPTMEVIDPFSNTIRFCQITA